MTDSVKTQSIGVIGAGAFGTALAVAALRAGRSTLLWGRNWQDLVTIAEQGHNPTYLPGLRLNPPPRVSRDQAAVLAQDIIIIAVPTQQLRAVLSIASVSIRQGQSVILACKGLEKGTGKLVPEIARDLVPQANLALISGPAFASEVAAGLPTAVTLAAADIAVANALAAALSSRLFRCYTTTDLTGAAVGGAIKNILAIACGIVMGRKMGENARAAIISRGLAEMIRFGTALGASAETFTGLSGIGDITLTCTSPQSRNYTFGLQLGSGKTLADLSAANAPLAEGVATARAVMERAAVLGVELPICAAVDAVVNGGAGLDETITALLARPIKPEWTP